MLNSTRLIIPSIVATGLLTACSSSTETNGEVDSQLFSKGILVFIEDDSPADIGSAPYIDVSTFEMSTAKSMETIRTQTENFYTPAFDECVSFSGLNPPIEPFGFGEVTFVDAGQVLTLQANGNSVAELNPDGEGFYEWSGSASDSFPDNLELDIPGGALPALSAISIPELDGVVVTSEHMNGNGSGLIQWQADPKSNLPIWIVVDGNRLICITEDDGEFLLPDTVVEDSEINIIRRSVTVSNQDGVLIAIIRTSLWR